MLVIIATRRNHEYRRHLAYREEIMSIATKSEIERAVYTPEEVAAMTGLHVVTVREYLIQGKIPGVKPRGCRKWMISKVRFHEWLDGKNNPPTYAGENI
jgi:excisionase family DNA binding protein